MTAVMLTGCATPDAPVPVGGRAGPDPVLERAVEVFLTECLIAGVDDEAKMRTALGIPSKDKLGAAPVKPADASSGQTLVSVLAERLETRTDPFRLIRQEYVVSPGPYWNQAVLLLKVMGYKCLETEAL
jgi:hypothetical protein